MKHFVTAAFTVAAIALMNAGAFAASHEVAATPDANGQVTITIGEPTPIEVTAWQFVAVTEGDDPEMASLVTIDGEDHPRLVNMAPLCTGAATAESTQYGVTFKRTGTTYTANGVRATGRFKCPDPDVTIEQGTLMGADMFGVQIGAADPVIIRNFCGAGEAFYAQEDGHTFTRVGNLLVISLASGQTIYRAVNCSGDMAAVEAEVTLTEADTGHVYEDAALTGCAYPRLAEHFSAERWAYWAKKDGLAPAFGAKHRDPVVNAICTTAPTFMDRDTLMANGPWYSKTLNGVKTMEGWRIEVAKEVFYAIPKPSDCVGTCVTFSDDVPTHGHYGTQAKSKKKAAKKPAAKKVARKAKTEPVTTQTTGSLKFKTRCPKPKTCS